MRPIIGIIGADKNLCTKKMYEFATDLGDALLSNGYRIVTNGKEGISEAVSKGAMNSENYFEGSIISIIAEGDKKFSNIFCDIIIPTEIGIDCNLILINTSDILIAIGESKTMIALACSKNKIVLYVTTFDDVKKKIELLNSEFVIPVENIEQIINIINSKT